VISSIRLHKAHGDAGRGGKEEKEIKQKGKLQCALTMAVHLGPRERHIIVGAVRTHGVVGAGGTR
jgi:hypothetical protein